MTAQLRSELLKQHTTRTNVLLLLWMVGLIVLVVLLHVLSFSIDDLSRRDNQLKIAGLGTSVGALFASLLGAMSITGEFRHGTIRPTLLATPRRDRVIVAKVVGNQHRHPVAASAGQRDAHQQVVGLTVGLVHRPHAVAAGRRPVDLDVA